MWANPRPQPGPMSTNADIALFGNCNYFTRADFQIDSKEGC